MSSDAVRSWGQAERTSQPPAVVIVGETGSGKSALAVELAKRYSGEVIAADSRTVYRGMDIGTAKPTRAEQRGIRHHGFDVVMPDGRFTAYDFQQLARTVVADIARRKKLPIIAGGAGLYVDAFLYGFTFRGAPDERLRAELETLSVSELQDRIRAAGLPMPANVNNPRHLVRLLEGGMPPSQNRVLRPHTLVLGLPIDREALERRIAGRVDAMFAAGFLDEASRLYNQYGDIEALRTPGYRAAVACILGSISLDEAKRQFIRADLQLAKRQRTWFKRNKDIHWLIGKDPLAKAGELITTTLLS